MLQVRDEERKKRIMSAEPRSTRSDVVSPEQNAENNRKINKKPGIPESKEAWAED